MSNYAILRLSKRLIRELLHLPDNVQVARIFTEDVDAFMNDQIKILIKSDQLPETEPGKVCPEVSLSIYTDEHGKISFHALHDYTNNKEIDLKVEKKDECRSDRAV